jgi:hypothetical protein
MNERSIFLEALDKEDPIQRSAYLDTACGGDDSLRLRVEALLKSHFEAGSFLGKLAPERVADELALYQTADENQCVTPVGAPANGDLDFLLPTDKAGVLGRLGHYDIHEVIGRGGMGIVLKAFDGKLHRMVAIKVMAPVLAASPSARQRFIREAQASAAVRNDHVIDIYAVDEGNDPPFLVMEYISGVSLQERLDRNGLLKLAEILRIGMQIASGLAAAHAQGLIHRDVKPANILLENGVERVKITDFGLARAVDDASLTQSGVVAGTPHYMSPEQSRGEAVDQRSDLFSLGSVLYVMCTGRAPFRASGSMAVLKRVCDEPAPPLREANPQIPDWLAAIVDKLHAKNPADRFQSAAEVAELLGKHLAHLQQPALVPKPNTLPSPLRGSALGHRAGGDGAKVSHRRWLVAAGVLILLLGGVGFTEATGVTRLTSTVIRFLTPVGTLVVEVDDPDIKVTVDADGGLVITGAGPHEIRLHPGSYRLQASKDGKPIRNEIVTIIRGEKQVVSVRLEPGTAFGEIHRFEGHHEPVFSLSVSADGTRAITGGWDWSARVWDLEKRKEFRRFSVHNGIDQAIYCVALSPDGQLALAGSRKGTVWLWDVETGEERWRQTIPVVEQMGVTSVVFSPDGRFALVGGGDGIARLWEVSPWKEVHRLKHDRKNVWSVCFSPDGHKALTAGGPDPGETGGGIRLWNLQTGTELYRFKGQDRGVWQAVFSPDGDYVLSAGMDATVRLWDAHKGTEVRPFKGHTQAVNSVAFAPDSRKAISAGADNVIRYWDVETGQEMHSFHDGEASVKSLAYIRPGHRALSGNYKGTVRLWQLPP